MADRRFYTISGPLAVSEIAALTGTAVPNGSAASLTLRDVAPLDRAGPDDLSFFDNAKYLDQFAASKAGACFVRPKYAGRAPSTMIALVTEDPYRCFALAAQQFYPPSRPKAAIHPTAVIEPTAKVAATASIAAGVVIGARAEIGEYVVIDANAVIGEGVIVGNETRIGAVSTLSHCFVGERCIIHRGVHIGQDGFGFAMGRQGHVKVPQLGRVIIGNDVEIGSSTTIDRGTGPDTEIGDGTKIDNLVQIGHNVVMGKLGIMVAQSGISGSTHVGDGVAIGGQTGIAGHLKIGSGAKIAAKSGVISDIAPGSSYGGVPAVPITDWHRQSIALKRLIKRGTHE